MAQDKAMWVERIFYGTFPGKFISGSAVVVAKDMRNAKTTLINELKERGIDVDRKDIELKELRGMTKVRAIILDDGDY